MAGAGTLIGGVVAVGVGEAAGTALEPVLEPQKQAAWAASEAKVLDLGSLAALAAQGLISEAEAVAEGKRNGYAESRVQRAIQLSLTAAPVAELLELWRRGKINEALVDHGLAKASIEPQYWEPIKELFVGRLDPAIIATAIQRGIMPDPGFLPVGPPTAAGKVPAFPVSKLDPIAEARAHGIDPDRLFVETAIVGLPLSLQEAASAYFRSIIELPDFQRAVSEGNTRNEWGAAALEQARQILTAGEYAELELRGYYDRATRLENTAKHGMSTADSDLLYDVQGRGVNVHQVLIGERRGGVFEGPIDTIPKEYLFALQRGNLRPEVYNLAYAARETYPSYFVTRSLLQSHVITPERGRELFLGLGWPEDVAHAAADFFGGATTAKADTHVAKAQSQLWTTLHRSYLSGESSEAEVGAALPRAGVAAGSVSDVLATWDEERTIIRKQLSPAQVKKAYAEAVLNPETGVAWTKDEATAALVARGYSTADATTFLEL